MAVKPVKNVPKNPYGSLGPSPATVKKVTSTGLQTNAGWGAATQANNLNTVPGNTLKYDVPSAPAVTVPAPGGGGGGGSSGGGGGGASTPGHWNIPDYAALLAGDWEPEQAAIKGQKLQGEAETAFQLALRRAFIDYGGDANSIGEQYRKYIDDPTIEAAKNNKFSTMAQNLETSTRNLNNQRAQLAARGMTRSGQNTDLTRRALESRQIADYNAGRTFTGGAEEGLKGLATTGQTIADMISEAKSRAAARIAQENPQTWTPGTGDDPYGSNSYDDYYGSYTPPAATPPPAAAPPAAVKPPAGTVVWGGSPLNASQMAAELARTGVNRATWIRNHPAAAQTLGWA